MDALETPPPLLETKVARTEPRPLLPSALLGPGAILWLWIVPMLVLFALNYQAYLLIEGNMDDQERGNAALLGAAGILNVVAGAALWRSMMRKRVKEPGSALWGLPAVVAQAGYLWLAMSMERDLVPGTVTQWIYTTDRFLYNQFAFAMPALFWGVVRLACARPAKDQRKALAVSAAAAIGAPVGLFVAYQVIRALATGHDGIAAVVVVMVVLAGLAMFVGLIRLLALSLRDLQAWSPTTQRLAIVVFALMMPIAGLLLNRSIPFPNDFQAWEVYALTTLNAALLLVASWQHGRRPLLSHGLLCATLPFSLYFFVVFLPFLPLSVLAVIVMGAGFLVLTPTVLLVLHLSLLNKSRQAPLGARVLVGVMSFALLPGFFTVRALADKAALNAALDHVYAPTVTPGDIRYPSSRLNLKRALANHRSYKNGIYYPLLSDFYAWLVFDNLVLPDDKLVRLENVFIGEAGTNERGDFLRSGGGWGWRSVRDRHRMPSAIPPPRDVVVDRMEVKTAPADGGATTVTMALTLRNMATTNAEYVKLLPLPPGVFVNGFRLHVNGEPVPGRITEKKTALWVYSMIRDVERRDPGLLFYNAPDELELRVFPVVPGVPSVVEVDFLAPTKLGKPEEITNDPARVPGWIGERLQPRLAHDERGVVAAGGLERVALPAVKRPSYAHVIVDRSKDNGFDSDLTEALRRVRAKFPGAADVRVTLANYETRELASGGERLATLPLQGGFLADLAIAQAIRSHAERDLDGRRDGGVAPYPVFVVLAKQTKPLAKAEMRLTNAWADLLPRLELHGLAASGTWQALSEPEAKDAPLLRLGESQRPWVKGRAPRFNAAGKENALEYWEPDTRTWRAVEGVRTMEDSPSWVNAAALQMVQQDYERTPGSAGVDLKALVKASRESGVMVASTSYIVVENAAQWRMLEQSERQKLDQNTALNFKEAPAPPVAWLAAGFGLWCGMRRRRSRRVSRDNPTRPGETARP